MQLTYVCCIRNVSHCGAQTSSRRCCVCTYKICLFVFKCLNHSAPQYLQYLVIPYKQERSLRSANTNLIEKYPAVQKRTGERSFAFNAGKYWNLLPKELRLTRKIDRFKADLKTFLFENVAKFKPFL